MCVTDLVQGNKEEIIKYAKAEYVFMTTIRSLPQNINDTLLIAW